MGGAGSPSTYTGTVKVLIEDEGSAGTWYETSVFIMGDGNGETEVERNGILFDQIGLNPDNDHGGQFPFGAPDGTVIATDDIRGFAQMADDDLSVIKFVHTNRSGFIHRRCADEDGNTPRYKKRPAVRGGPRSFQG